MATDGNLEFEALLLFLRDSRGFDFTGYKRASLIRRVERRMQQVSLSSYADYLDLLQLQPDEFTALFNTILINVTSFFRDADAWDHLQQDALPAMLAAAKPSDPIRVWSAGCASGEEAYTVAMVLAEMLGPEQFRQRVKIYATDVDEEALTQARQATYSASAMKSVPDVLRERYFEPQGQRFAFRSDLRRSVIFGRNDLVQDAPISRVDLLLCRNTLMYFNAETQARIVNRLHFALGANALLFLGKAEMLLAHSELFNPLDLKRRFFGKVPRTGVVGRMHGLGNGMTEVGVGPAGLASTAGEALAASPVATLLISPEGVLLFSNSRAETLFGVSERDVGRPFRDLDISYRPVELRSYIDEAMTDRRTGWVRDVELTRGRPGESTFFDIQVTPMSSGDGTVVGVALYASDVTRSRQLQMELEATTRQLETAYEELQSTVEELETTNEELQSTVEELETTNEELQSTNEELETMNEELQSTNDELQTINDELRGRTRDVHDANSFLEAILRSLRTSVVVIDQDLVVTAWNQRSEDMWGLRQDEVVGQHLLNLDIGLPVADVRPLLRRTLAGEDEPGDLTLPAVNRRGRTITVTATSVPLMGERDQRRGVILLIDEV